MSLRFGEPPFPQSEGLSSAYYVCLEAHVAASGFLDLAEPMRDGSGQREDLLRATLVFAAAGLDGTAKELIREGLPLVLQRADATAEAALVSFVKRRAKPDTDLLARALASADSRKFLIDTWISEFTAGSLQSVQELSRVAEAFDIKIEPDLLPQKSDLESLRSAFLVRNQIIHEMDIIPGSSFTRRARAIPEMTELAKVTLATTGRLLSAVDKKIPR